MTDLLDRLRELDPAADAQGWSQSPEGQEVRSRVVEPARRNPPRWAAAVIAAVVVVLATVSVVVVLNRGGDRSKVESATTPAPDSASVGSAPGVVANFDLPSREFTADSEMNLRVVVTNETTQPVDLGICKRLFAATLGNQQFQQQVVWPQCLEAFTVPVGTSTFTVPVNTRYTGCDLRGESPACGVQGAVVKPLPEGVYQLRLETAPGVDVRLPKPINVRVNALTCSGHQGSARPPDVIGKRLADALRAIARRGFHVVGFGVPAGDPTSSSAEVFAEKPGSDEVVPQGSCIGLRTREVVRATSPSTGAS